MTHAPPPVVPSPSSMLRPHRGVMILVFGILSLVFCVIFGIIAWVMGNADLAEMDAGQMDAEGRGLTQAGKILGIISVVLNIIAIVAMVAMLAVGGLAIGAAGAAGAS